MLAKSMGSLIYMMIAINCKQMSSLVSVLLYVVYFTLIITSIISNITLIQTPAKLNKLNTSEVRVEGGLILICQVSKSCKLPNWKQMHVINAKTTPGHTSFHVDKTTHSSNQLRWRIT